MDTASVLAFLAGSSLPVTRRLPDVELPLACDIEEALMVGVGGSDPMDYHALEAMQCMGRAAQGWRNWGRCRATHRRRCRLGSG